MSNICLFDQREPSYSLWLRSMHQLSLTKFEAWYIVPHLHFIPIHMPAEQLENPAFCTLSKGCLRFLQATYKIYILSYVNQFILPERKLQNEQMSLKELISLAHYYIARANCI